MIPVSGCVISFNEEDRIRSCLESLSFCAEILVLDSGSTDLTREIAAEMGARVELQPFLGHRRQKQRAVDLAAHDWILSLDCDERVPPELRKRIEEVLDREPREVVGFSMPRRNRYLGRIMRHGLFWPDRKLRLFDRRKAFWGGRDPHDRVEPREDGRTLELDAPIEHDSYRSFAEHRRTIEDFSLLSARSLSAEGRGASPLEPWTRSLGALIKGLLLKKGFLDGWRGFLAAWMSARYDFLKYRELRRLCRAEGK